MINNQYNIIDKIYKELDRQQNKWGEQNHHPYKWLAILIEKIGKASEASLEAFPFKEKLNTEEYWLNKYREELIQVAAVAISAIDSLERNALEQIKKTKEELKND